MRCFHGSCFLTVLVGLLAAPSIAFGSGDQVVVQVDISDQTMRVFYDLRQQHEWKVSTARAGKVTPRGTWNAKWLSRHHRSSIYRGAPMPYSIFYNGNYAVHGTNQTSKLGRPASAGCIRLHPDNAAVLFELAKSYGLENTIIEVVD
jgi:lipoprotein-anchoring transpeptidase ErfK/SrfK